MRLSKQVIEALNDEVVRRINEIYHDFEHVYYDKGHDNILHFEASFWHRIAKKYMVKTEPSVYLDYGTGTGFVPCIVGPYLKECDHLICVDLSAAMLNVCAENVSRKGLKCELSFCRTDGTNMPAEDNSVDAVTVNSVLHHIYDLTGFARECRRVLKPFGILCVAHEPNRNRAIPLYARFIAQSMKVLFRPKSVFLKVAEKNPMLERTMRNVLGRVSKSYQQRNRMLTEVGNRVREEKLVDFELSGLQIAQIVNFHSYYGFDSNELFSTFFDSFELVEFETSDHLGFVPRTRFALAIDGYLRRNWPASGRLMRFVLRIVGK
jgi:ubiquinone/menaquinone biosynthesis C-methylase UbiE